MNDKHQDLTAPEQVEAGANDGPANDGIDRRNFLSCMAWAGTGLLWTMAGGVPTSKLFAATAGAAGDRAVHADSGFSFVQVSDSHIGFNKAANQDVTGTLKLALDKINGLPAAPDLLLHTGDITHSAKPAEFDTAQQLIRGVKAGEIFYVPASMTSPRMREPCISTVSARALKAAAGTASRIKACTSSASTIASRSMPWASLATNS